ncbi:hypothetical protein KIN20_023147 [Parelaphostrongylus tenuis]|uniref:Uncharacterized protein n=1 Tax=Parelaphostrongylus tenuis TaxID=148309 RepID=A0AAD5N687_PARTN|nr:hypothetical protein KIN20_023147 [Parelaphostrongylus tenuis]
MDNVSTRNSILICKPGEKNALCDEENAKLWLPKAEKLVAANGVKDKAGATLEVQKGEIVIVLDPGCEISFAKEHNLRHRFQNKPEKIRKALDKYPGFYLQPTIFHKRRKYQGGNQLSFGGTLHKGVDRTYKKIQCNAGVRICLQGRQGFEGKSFLCNDADLLNVYIRNGFATMPGAQNGAPIRFIKSTNGTTGPERWKVRPTQIGFDFDGERGENNGIVYQIDKNLPIDDVSTESSAYVTYSTVAPRGTLGTIATASPTPNVSAEAPVTTTKERNIAIYIGTVVESAELKARTGWMIWMIFYGFFIGSLLALILAAAILYLARRTVYTDWFVICRHVKKKYENFSFMSYTLTIITSKLIDETCWRCEDAIFNWKYSSGIVECTSVMAVMHLVLLVALRVVRLVIQRLVVARSVELHWVELLPEDSQLWAQRVVALQPVVQLVVERRQWILGSFFAVVILAGVWEEGHGSLDGRVSQAAMNSSFSSGSSLRSRPVPTIRAVCIN